MLFSSAMSNESNALSDMPRESTSVTSRSIVDAMSMTSFMFPVSAQYPLNRVPSASSGSKKLPIDTGLYTVSAPGANR